MNLNEHLRAHVRKSTSNENKVFTSGERDSLEEAWWEPSTFASTADRAPDSSMVAVAGRCRCSRELSDERTEFE